MNLKKPKISAVIACYGDGEAIPFMHKRLVSVFKKIAVDYEIIFVNDGSPDNTKEVLNRIIKFDKKVTAINHTRNFGSQNAFTSGLKICTGDAAVLLDGDLQDPPELITELHKKWRKGFDVVYGIRVKRDATLFLQIAYKLFYRVFKAASYIPIPLDAGDFSLLDRKVIDALNSLPENNRFMRGLRSWVGFKQTGIPYKRPERMFGQTTNSLFKNLDWARKGIFSFSYIPLDSITFLAISIFLLSFLFIFARIIISLFTPNSISYGYTLIIVLVLALSGIQLLCIGIIGSYIAHIYDEVKRRPPFIVESIINAPKSHK